MKLYSLSRQLQHVVQELEGLKVLPDKSNETPENTARALWLAAQGKPVGLEFVHKALLEPLSEDNYRKLLANAEKRLQGVPLAHLTGRQSFMGRDYIVGEKALIPRLETEILAEAALEKLAAIPTNLRVSHKLEESSEAKPITIIDTCTGSGNLALTLAFHRCDTNVYASDISGDAIELAGQNVHLHGLEDRVQLQVSDLLHCFDSQEFYDQVDLICCNPPYIASHKVSEMPVEISHYEPKEAFDGGPLGVQVVCRLIADSARLLKPGGWLCFEVGLGQGSFFQKQLSRHSIYHNIQSHKDSQGHIRALCAQRVQ